MLTGVHVLWRGPVADITVNPKKRHPFLFFSNNSVIFPTTPE